MRPGNLIVDLERNIPGHVSVYMSRTKSIDHHSSSIGKGERKYRLHISDAKQRPELREISAEKAANMREEGTQSRHTHFITYVSMEIR